MGVAEKSSRPSAATVMSAIAMVAALGALAISLSGIAGAASKRSGKVQRGDIAPGAVDARALAPGAVHRKKIASEAVTSPKLATGAVNKRTLKKGSVTAATLAANAVTAGAIAPGSVYAGALGNRTLHLTTIKDADEIAANPDWTAGDTNAALCGPGEALLGTGFTMPNPGNRQVTWLQVSPFLSSTGEGVLGRFASNSGGTAEGQVIALCLQ